MKHVTMQNHIQLCVIIFTMSTADPGPLYPFGAGDTVNNRSDDGSSMEISLQQPFVYFGHKYETIYVNNNGDLTFVSPFFEWTPNRFPGNSTRDIIAPFWTDMDNRDNGTISYQQYNTSGSILQQATQDISQYFPNLGFSANWVFIATWNKVAYFPLSGTETTFQVVLISGGQSSFVLMNYGEIAPRNNFQAGYDTVNSINYFSIPGSFQSNGSTLMNSSNVNIAGRWAFRIDGSQDQTPFTHAKVNISSYDNLDNNAIVLYIEEFFKEISNNTLGPVKVTLKRATKCGSSQCGIQLPPFGVP